MKKVKISCLVIVTSMLMLSACNDQNKKKTDEKNGNSITEIKKDTSSSPISLIPSAPIAYSATNLPPGVKDFISKNYVGYTIVSASPDPLCEGGAAVDVAITKKSAPTLSLIFTPDGSFVQQEEDVPLSTASDKIRDIIKTKYAGYSAGNQIEKLTLVNKTKEYMVDLKKGKINKEVIFSLDGNIVCEKSE